MPNIALLAPVPREHLISGLETIAKVGKVAFGTRAWEAFVGLKVPEEGAPPEVFIYESGVEGIKGPPMVTWAATYVGLREGRGGAHPDGMTFRPKSTLKYPLDNAGNWAAFWEVAGLHELAPAERLPIAALFSLKTMKKFPKTFRPRGPIQIAI